MTSISGRQPRHLIVAPLHFRSSFPKSGARHPCHAGYSPDWRGRAGLSASSPGATVRRSEHAPRDCGHPTTCVVAAIGALRSRRTTVQRKRSSAVSVRLRSSHPPPPSIADIIDRSDRGGAAHASTAPGIPRKKFDPRKCNDTVRGRRQIGVPAGYFGVRGSSFGRLCVWGRRPDHLAPVRCPRHGGLVRNPDGLSVDPAEFAQPPVESLVRPRRWGDGAKKSDSRQLARLLRSNRERPQGG